MWASSPRIPLLGPMLVTLDRVPKRTWNPIWRVGFTALGLGFWVKSVGFRYRASTVFQVSWVDGKVWQLIAACFFFSCNHSQSRNVLKRSKHRFTQVPWSGVWLVRNTRYPEPFKIALKIIDVPLQEAARELRRLEGTVFPAHSLIFSLGLGLRLQGLGIRV